MDETTAVSAHDLTVQFGAFTAVDHVSFTVRPGEIFGFLGANGAGKTTTIRVLCGLLIPTSGVVSVAGINVHDDPNLVKSKVGYMSQKFTLYDDLTVEENLTFAAQLRKLDSKSYVSQRQRLLQFISFQRPLSTLVKDLPGGMKQKVSLAAALLHEPEVIFLDEPTAGVTPVSRAMFWDLIRELSKNGKTIFVTTHYMDEAEQCDRIALMRTGQIIALDTPTQLKKESFPNGILELVPRHEHTDMSAWRRRPEIESLEPYGLRFHATLRDSAFRAELEKDFTIRRIDPSLEDVFIRRVEGRTS